MSARPTLTAVIGALVWAAVAGPPPLAAQQTVPPPPGDPIYACEIDGSEPMRVTQLALENPMADAAAVVAERARMLADGRVLVLDATARSVAVLDSALSVETRFGSRGEGPGELGRPVDVAPGPDGTWLVLDAQPRAVEVFSAGGEFLRSIPLPVIGMRIDAGETTAYVSADVVALSSARGFPMVANRGVVLLAVDLSSGATETLLEYDASWTGGPPLYTNRFTQTIPRVGVDGALYLAFQQSYEIWRIDAPGQATPVVRGCIPRQLLRLYRDQPRRARSADLISDFHVMEDGRVLVRGGLIHEDGTRPWQLFGPDGSLLKSWRLGPAELLHLGTSISPARPNRHVTWNRATGILRLVEFEPEG